jgi:hypothetical protein
VDWPGRDTAARGEHALDRPWLEILGIINASLRKTAVGPSSRRLVHRPGLAAKSGRFAITRRSFPSRPELPS